MIVRKQKVRLILFRRGFIHDSSNFHRFSLQFIVLCKTENAEHCSIVVVVVVVAMVVVVVVVVVLVVLLADITVKESKTR